MSTIIKLKHSDAGIGVNFYNDKEEKNYNKIIEFVKSSVSNKTPLSMTDVEWDLDNMTLGHSDPSANKLLKKITLRLEH